MRLANGWDHAEDHAPGDIRRPPPQFTSMKLPSRPALIRVGTVSGYKVCSSPETDAQVAGMDDHGHDDANQAAVEGHAPVQI